MGPRLQPGLVELAERIRAPSACLLVIAPDQLKPVMGTGATAMNDRYERELREYLRRYAPGRVPVW